MKQILTDKENQRLKKLQKQVEKYSDYKYRQIGKILDPVLKNIEKYSNEEIQHLIDTMAPISFYRAEIRTYLNKRIREVCYGCK
jgi:hypothetical protein